MLANAQRNSFSSFANVGFLRGNSFNRSFLSFGREVTTPFCRAYFYDPELMANPMGAMKGGAESF